MIRSSQSKDGKKSPSRGPVLGQYPNGALHAHSNVTGVDDLARAFKSTVTIASTVQPPKNFQQKVISSDGTYGADARRQQQFASKQDFSSEWEREKKELLLLFEKQAEEKLNNLPSLASKPTQFKDTTKLKPFQNEAVRWMVDMERNPRANANSGRFLDGNGHWFYKDLHNDKWLPNGPYSPAKGSILADEMGLGKTLQTISLILHNPPQGHVYGSSSSGPIDQPVCTVIVCPSIVVCKVWHEEIQKFVKPGTFRIKTYCGAENNRKQRSNKIISLLQKNELDILLATYSVIGAELEPLFNKRKTQRYDSIHDAKFFRVILDEAHHIKNPKTDKFEGAKSIADNSRYCLALTGTPLVNGPSDLFPLLSVLKYEPLDNQETFDERIAKPIDQKQRAGLERLRKALAHVVLRRTKNMLPNIDLIGKKDIICKVDFDNDAHKKTYKILYQVAHAAFDGLLNGGGEDDATSIKITKNDGLTMATRIIRCCCSPALVPAAYIDRAQQELGRLQDNRGKIKKLTASEAFHVLRNLEAGKKDQDDLSMTYRNDLSTLPPAKITKLLHLIQDMSKDEKGIIFSQWTTFLDLIQEAMVDAGHQVVRIDGNIPPNKRTEALRSFSSDDNNAARFMLCSLGSGEGINLSRGNVVFVMDTWWNQAKELQAIDRCHRFGQSRPVRSYHLVMKNTLEERMLNTQKAKAVLGKGIMTPLNKQDEKVAKTREFLKDLYQLKSREEIAKDQRWE